MARRQTGASKEDASTGSLLIRCGMDEFQRITEEYDAAYVRDGPGSLEALNRLALTFYKDVAAIYDGLIRLPPMRYA